MMGNIFLMVIVIVRFRASLKATSGQEVLSKTEMETMLNSSAPLPSSKTVSAASTDPKMKQLGALYALHKFLRKTADY